MKICNKCNLEFDDKFMFCNRCGSKLQENIELVFCPYCGEKIETDGEFCPFCGKNLNEDGSFKKLDSEESISENLNVQKSVVSDLPVNISPVKTNNSSSKNSNAIHSNAIHSVIKHNVKTEEKEESKIVSWVKFIAYAIGMIVLWFIFKVLIKGSVMVLRSDGIGLPFIIIFVLAGCVLYFMLYRDNE